MAAQQADAIQYQFLQHVETAWLQKAPAADLQGNRLRFAATVKAFNMSASYATSFGSGAREQVQNWMDQCRVTVPDRQPVVHQMDSAVLSMVAQQYRVIVGAKSYAAFGQDSSRQVRLLGVVVDYTDAAGHQLLVLKNYGAQMTLDSLILGESSKRNDTALAGQYGEGAKVEINRLVQEGCEVKYCTGNAIWTFERLTTPGCTTPELHVRVQPGQHLYDCVYIAILTGPQYKGRLLEVDRFLFLQGPYTHVSSRVIPNQRWSGMELLLDQSHWGKVFIHGIFVVEAPKYKEFGLNYTGDKTIFSRLGFGRDRNAINDRFLILGLPAMFRDLRKVASGDAQRMHMYKQAVAKLIQLMWCKGTALQELIDYAYTSSCFQNFDQDLKQLTEEIFNQFTEQHPNAFPVSMACAKAQDQAEMDDLKYLQFTTEEVPKTAYQLFQEHGLLQTKAQIWERRKQEILGFPDPFPGLSAEWQQYLLTLQDELQKVFKKYVKKEQIVFRRMPAGHENVLRGFTTHFVIDVNIVEDIAKVHKLLAAASGAASNCQPPCQCLRQLMNISMTDALARQQGGPSKERIMFDVMGSYMEVCKYGLEMPAAPNAAVSPGSYGHSNAVNGAAPASAAPAGAAPNSNGTAARPEGDAPSSHGIDADLSLNGLNIEEGSRNGSSPTTAKVQPSVRVETPVVPTAHTLLVFHNGIRSGIAAVLQHSAGHSHGQGVVRSSGNPSTAGPTDTIIVKACPETSKHKLVASSIPLMSCLVEGNQKRLHLPEGFDESSWSVEKSESAKQLYHLLERLHELFLPGVAAVNLYYDADDGCIAFNKANQLWYNAYADRLHDGSPQILRLCDWYITVCHELTHNFCKEHDEVFSDYLAQIVLQKSAAFFAMCKGYHVDITAYQI